MAVRNFTANHEVRAPAGTYAGTGAFTYAALLKRNSTSGWQAILAGHNSAGSYQWEFGFDGDAGGRPIFYVVSGNAGSRMNSNEMTAIQTTSWFIIVYRKPAGSALGVFSIYHFGNGTWVHQAGGVYTNTPGNPATIVNGHISTGEASDVDDLNGRVGVVGWWSAELSQSQVEALATNLRTSDWVNHAVAPVDVLEYNQASAGDAIPMLVSGGSISGTISGAADHNGVSTTVVTGDDPPGWTFDGAGAPTGDIIDAANVSGSMDFNMAGIGAVRRNGSATGSMDFGMSGSGTALRRGVATGSMDFAMSGSGTALRSGGSAGSLGMEMTGAGTAVRRGGGALSMDLALAADPPTLIAAGGAAMSAEFTMQGAGDIVGAPTFVDAAPQSGSMGFNLQASGGVIRQAAPQAGSVAMSMDGRGSVLRRGGASMSLGLDMVVASPSLLLAGGGAGSMGFEADGRGSVWIFGGADFIAVFTMDGRGDIAVEVIPGSPIEGIIEKAVRGGYAEALPGGSYDEPRGGWFDA